MQAFPHLFVSTNGTDYMASRIEYVEFVQPLLNMEQMAALLYCAQDFLWQDAHDKIEEEKRPQPKTLLTKPCGTETIFLVLSLLTPDKSMPYNWFPSLFCTHRAHIEKFLATDHYYYKDGEIDEAESFTEVVPCRGFEMRPYKRICELLLQRVFNSSYSKRGMVIVPYGLTMETKRTGTPGKDTTYLRTNRSLLNEAPQWFKKHSFTTAPYREFNAFPCKDFIEPDEFVASYMGEDTLHVLSIDHVDPRFFNQNDELELREYVFNLPMMWMKWMETKKKSQGMTPFENASFRYMHDKYMQTHTKIKDIYDVEYDVAPGYTLVENSKRQKREEKEKD